MNIVSNSSPLIFLAKLGRLDVLNRLFDKVYIPQAVYNEVVLADKDDDANHLIEEKIKTGQINRFKVQNEVAIRTLLGRLHQGEVEAIIGAGELKINSVILDDLYARNKAKQLDLAVTGTLGILLLAYKRGLVEDLKAELQKLIAAGYRISDALIQTVIREIEIDNRD